MAGGVAQLVECLSSKSKSVSLDPSTAKIKQTKKHIVFGGEGRWGGPNNVYTCE
jgi:hypothetical protein